MAGPLGPGVGQTLSAQSVSWLVTASGTKRALAPAWSASATVSANDARLVVTSDGIRRIYVYPTGATTGSTAPTAVGTGLTDGTAINVVGYALGVAGFSNGISVQNTDTSLTAYGGDVGAQNAPLLPNGGARGVLLSDPSLYYVVAPSGGPVLGVEGWP
jgi:hypothetical protein